MRLDNAIKGWRKGDGGDILSGSKILILHSVERSWTSSCGQLDTKSMDQVYFPFCVKHNQWSSLFLFPMAFQPIRVLYAPKWTVKLPAFATFRMCYLNVFQDSVLSDDSLALLIKHILCYGRVDTRMMRKWSLKNKTWPPSTVGFCTNSQKPLFVPFNNKALE